MPIRFRCAYCNQLMGIARRKAGTVVRCPTCAGQVVVPSPEPGEADPPSGTDQPLFERSDFDQVFRMDVEPPAAAAPPRPAPMPAAAPPAGAWGTHAEPPFDVERLDPSHGPLAKGAAGGIVLSSGRATILAVAFILIVAVAFGAGFFVGRL